MISRAIIAVAVTAAIVPAARAATPNSAIGVWINPKNSLLVQTAPCGTELCGAIIHANPTALSDAREAGVDHLIGTQLLQNYRPVDPRTWRGRVYVPDMGRTFSSKIEQLDFNALKISGCLFGTFFCKSQVWHRVK